MAGTVVATVSLADVPEVKSIIVAAARLASVLTEPTVLAMNVTEARALTDLQAALRSSKLVTVEAPDDGVEVDSWGR